MDSNNFKYVCKIKRSLYIYNTKNFFPCLMCDITIMLFLREKDREKKKWKENGGFVGLLM